MEADVRPPPESSTHPFPSAEPTQDVIFRGLSSYPFTSDPAFKEGLTSILENTEPPKNDEEKGQLDETIARAKSFYFARKYNLPPIDNSAYKNWLESQSQSKTTAPPHSATQPTYPEEPPDPPYPTSFAAIVDLITRNQPIPGIETIPDTVLEHGSSPPNKTPRRKKPWEKDGDEREEHGEAALLDAVMAESSSSTAYAGSSRKKDVIRVLQPLPSVLTREVGTENTANDEVGA